MLPTSPNSENSPLPFMGQRGVKNLLFLDILFAISLFNHKLISDLITKRYLWALRKTAAFFLTWYDVLLLLSLGNLYTYLKIYRLVKRFDVITLHLKARGLFAKQVLWMKNFRRENYEPPNEFSIFHRFHGYLLLWSMRIYAHLSFIWLL